MLLACGCQDKQLRYNKHQSINQSNSHSANIAGEARLSDMTAKSVFNIKIEETVP